LRTLLSWVDIISSGLLLVTGCWLVKDRVKSITYDIFTILCPIGYIQKSTGKKREGVNRMKQLLMYIVLAVVTATVSMLANAEGWTPKPTIVKGKGEECVEPTEVMRKRHFEFILHQRDETMHRGIRTEKYSLTGCIDCHAKRGEDGEFLPINAKGQFCQSCHSYAAVSMDCFQCHATKPAEKSED
jgi:hypothetical protein